MVMDVTAAWEILHRPVEKCNAGRLAFVGESLTVLIA